MMWTLLRRLPKLTCRWPRFWSYALFFIGPVMSLFIVETLNNTDPIKNLNFTELWMNLALYSIVWLAIRLILGRRRRSAAVGSIFFFLAGLVNHYVLEFKGIILFPHDLGNWRTALNVVGTYDFTPDEEVLRAICLLACYLSLVYLLARPEHKRNYPSPVWINYLVAAGAVAYCYAFFFSPWLINAGIKTQQWKTQCNGWVLNFSLALRYGQVEKPEEYSQQQVKELTEELAGEEAAPMRLWKDAYCATPYDPSTSDEGQTAPLPLLTLSQEADIQPVNLLCIMDESFGDLSLFENLTTNTDVLPFFHGLTDNTIKGWMYSPVTGGGTASVEYEFLTGNSITFLPPGTVAYQLYVKDKMPSLFSWANSLGYTTTAFHPYDRTGWNRVAVYEDFGADVQLYQEDVESPRYVRSYISDLSGFQTLFDITDEAQDDPQFVFHVTMQNHGGYKQGWNNLEQTIELTESLSGVSEYATQYLNLMHKTDQALERLLDHYSKVSEPTLIVFFGDHQGKLSDWFYERLYGKPLSERTLAEVQLQYAVPFFIWANYDIEEAQDVLISANYLGALTAKLSGLPMTGYQEFLCKAYEEIPVIGRVSYITADGQVTDEMTELSPARQELLLRYQTLSYQSLFKRNPEIDQAFFELPQASR